MFRTESGCFERNRGILIRESSADQAYFLVTADVGPEQGCSPTAVSQEHRGVFEQPARLILLALRLARKRSNGKHAP